MRITADVPATWPRCRRQPRRTGTPSAHPGSCAQPPGSATPIGRRESRGLTGNPDALTEFPGDQPEPKGRRAPAAGPPRAPRALRARAKGRAIARCLREQQGNAAVELAPVAMVFLLFLALAIAAGR